MVSVYGEKKKKKKKLLMCLHLVRARMRGTNAYIIVFLKNMLVLFGSFIFVIHLCIFLFSD